MLIVVISSALAILAQGQDKRTADYALAVRCAGLTQAASELEGSESRYGRALADSALFWTLTAFQAATAQDITYAAAEAEQRVARIQSVRRLNSSEAQARRQLTECRQKTPRLN